MLRVNHIFQSLVAKILTLVGWCWYPYALMKTRSASGTSGSMRAVFKQSKAYLSQSYDQKKFINGDLCGLRIKQIFDPMAQKSDVRYLKYG